MSDVTNRGGGEDDLVEPEGVNAASSAPQHEPVDPDADVRAGGHPAGGDAQAARPAPSELLGPPAQNADGPAEEQSGPGQELSVGEG